MYVQARKHTQMWEQGEPLITPYCIFHCSGSHFIFLLSELYSHRIRFHMAARHYILALWAICEGCSSSVNRNCMLCAELYKLNILKCHSSKSKLRPLHSNMAHLCISVCKQNLVTTELQQIFHMGLLSFCPQSADYVVIITFPNRFLWEKFNKSNLIPACALPLSRWGSFLSVGTLHSDHARWLLVQTQPETWLSLPQWGSMCNQRSVCHLRHGNGKLNTYITVYHCIIFWMLVLKSLQRKHYVAYASDN